MKTNKKTQSMIEHVILLAAAVAALITGWVAMKDGMKAGLSNTQEAVKSMTSKNF